ncbi:MAG: metallothionein [Pseudanabaenaceae cyanobacterium bins.39]|nr:metallothionein [Pseudanabaenaceae cyanobacterium bins.39]
MAETTKCACPKCTCTVSLDTAIMADGKPYCSQACADGHPAGSPSCQNSGCGCGS